MKAFLIISTLMSLGIIHGQTVKKQAHEATENKTALSSFNKDLAFEILNSKRGVTDQSSDKDISQCNNWTIPQTIIPSIIKDCKIISGNQWHDDFGVFPCIISGQLKQNGKTYQFEINGGSWIYIFSNGQTIILGSYKKEYEKYFIAKAWDGK